MRAIEDLVRKEFENEFFHNDSPFGSTWDRWNFRLSDVFNKESRKLNKELEL